jgi:hypothetical protein
MPGTTHHAPRSCCSAGSSASEGWLEASTSGGLLRLPAQTFQPARPAALAILGPAPQCYQAWPGQGRDEAAAAGPSQQEACEPGSQQALVDQELRLLNTALTAAGGCSSSSCWAEGRGGGGGGDSGSGAPKSLPRANSVPVSGSHSMEHAALVSRRLSLPAGFTGAPGGGGSAAATANADPPAAKRRRASTAKPPAAAPQAPAPRPAAAEVDAGEGEDEQSRRQHQRMQKNRNSAAASRWARVSSAASAAAAAPPLPVVAMFWRQLKTCRFPATCQLLSPATCLPACLHLQPLQAAPPGPPGLSGGPGA